MGMAGVATAVAAAPSIATHAETALVTTTVFAGWQPRVVMALALISKKLTDAAAGCVRTDNATVMVGS